MTVVLPSADTWQSIQTRFPVGWQPDAVVLYLQYHHVPPAILSAPIPVIALAGDWNLQWHAYRRILRHCDLVLTDSLGVEVMRREGIENVRPANLFGVGKSWTDFAWPNGERDIDVLFVGNFNPAVQRERLAWVARLAALRPRWNVVVASGVFDDEYRRLLARSRIAFNRGIRGECNCRVAEAIAAGALLFQERDNREVPMLLTDREECVLYDGDDLTDLLTYYLEHEDERKGIAAKARQRLSEFTFAHLWRTQSSSIADEMPILRERAQRRVSQGTLDLRARTWMDFSSTFGRDGALATDLKSAADESPRDPHLRNALGILALQEKTPHAVIEAARAFQEAWQSDPRHVVAGLNLAEMLILMGQREHANEQVRRTLAMLDELDVSGADLLDAPHAATAFDDFRVEWERAAWTNVGLPQNEAQAKVTLLRWRLHRILSDIHNDVAHGFIASAMRPDLPVGLAALGCALARDGHISEAIPFLRQALNANPFDLEAARALFEALSRAGLGPEHQRMACERRSLSDAAPGLIPIEAWFAPQTTSVVPDPSVAISALRITWHGSQDLLHSLALVNREICLRLISHGHELSLQPALHDDPRATRVPLPPPVADAILREFSSPADVHVSHQWPPNFTPPPDGHWIIMQPWEFGSVPRAWIQPLTKLVDEIWVPSHFVRDSFIRSSLPADRIFVVPCGVSDVFLRDGHSLFPVQTTKRFKFLFVGGTIERKGVDLLLKAYGQTFSDKDDVCLVIKDMGVGTFYQGQTAEQMIERFRQIPHAPEIEYLNRELNEEEMAGLYRTCDCLAHPYRGEGFGLPIAEAMASGLPVIVTGYGAALDFCHDEHAYLLPASVVHFREKRVGDFETVDHPWWAEPDQDALRFRLRYVATHLKDAKDKGKLAQDFIRRNFTWDHTVAILEQRLVELRKSPIRRKSLTYEHAPAPTALAPARSRPRVSLAMIVKNEEANLPACLQSVADLVNEIIIVDTGSTDTTKRIALQRGAKVYDFPWIDSFSAARNESLRHATGEWIFWMDADDRLDEENRVKLRELFTKLPSENLGFVMKCLCLPDADTGTATVVDHIRLFRNHPQVRWAYRIHEQILPSIRRQGGDVRWSDVVIHHVGYQNRAVRSKKLQRDLRLLTMEHEEQPNDAFTLFNLGSVYQEQGKTAEALDFFCRSLEGSQPEDSIVRKLYAMIIQCNRNLKQPKEALQVCEDARRHYPDDLEILFQEALTRRDLGDRTSAISCLERLLDRRDGQHFASIDTGLQGYKTRHNLAVFLQEEGRTDDAEKQWQLAIAEQPNFLPALTGLAEIHFTRRDWPTFNADIERLKATSKGDLEAGTLMARKQLADKNFTVARLTIEQTIASYPGAVWPRVVLTHILLQEGKDWAAAEKALRDVLTLDPEHLEALRNLEVLSQQRKATR